MLDRSHNTFFIDKSTLVVFLGALLTTILAFDFLFHGASTYEFANYAEMGRNIDTGHGLSSRVLYPATLAILQSRGMAKLDYPPVMQRFPLPAYLSALSQLLFGHNDFGSVAGTLFLFAGWVTIIYEVGRRWFSRTAGIIAALYFLVLPAGLKYFLLFNMPDIHFGTLILLLHAVIAGEDSFSARQAAFIGGLAGVLWLCRPNLWLLLPLYCCWFYFSAGGPKLRLVRVVAFLAVFAAVSTPYMCYQLKWFGTVLTPDALWNLSHHVVTEDLPWCAYRIYSLADVLSHKRLLISKGLVGFYVFLFDWTSLWQIQFFLPFLGIGLCKLPKGPARRLVILSALAFAIQFPVFCLLRFESGGCGVGYRYLFWFAPVILLVGAHGLWEILATMSTAKRRIALTLFVTLNVCFLTPYYIKDCTNQSLHHPSGMPPMDWPEIAFFRQNCHEREGVVTNIPAQVAWYAGTQAVVLPNDPEDVQRLDQVRPLRYLFISFINTGDLASFPRWMQMLGPKGAGLFDYCHRHGYRFIAEFPGGLLVDLHPTAAR